MRFHEIMTESANSFPLKRIKSGYHIGSMDISQKSGDSYEGAGISISSNPVAWGKIARIGFTPLWKAEKPNGSFLDNRLLTPVHRDVMAQWAVEQGLIEPSSGQLSYVITPKMQHRMMVKSNRDVYLLGFVAIAYAEDALNIDGVWWQMRFTGTDGPKGVIVPSKIDTWTWTRRDE